jgi:DNA-binding MltR family transcriptional regulator
VLKNANLPYDLVIRELLTLSSSEQTQEPGSARDKELLSKVYEALSAESDRGCVIFGSALISEALEELLKSFFRQAPQDSRFIRSLFDGYAPLSTFSARIQIAYAIGLVPRALRERIELIRKLRNEFAHESGPLSFENPHCGDRLQVLLDDSSMHRFFEAKQAAEGKPLATIKAETPKSLQFVAVVIGILGFLYGLADNAREGTDVRRSIRQDDEDF